MADSLDVPSGYECWGNILKSIQSAVDKLKEEKDAAVRAFTETLSTDLSEQS